MKTILWLASALLSAQSSVEIPPLAQVLDAQGRLTPIFGLPGNFYAGPPGVSLLSYSNDGAAEWKLEPGAVSITTAGKTTTLPTSARHAIFRGPSAIFNDLGDSLHFNGENLVRGSGQMETRIAGRSITWEAGRLRVVQPDGSPEEVACPQEPGEMTAAGGDWVHIIIGGESYLLHLRQERAQLYTLPRGRQE